MATTAQTGTTAKKKTAKAAPASTTTAKPKTAAAKQPPTRTAPARKPRSNGAKGPQVDPDQRRYYIEVAAYYIAERRGFMGGHEAEDWAAAEFEIDRMLLEGKLNR